MSTTPGHAPPEPDLFDRIRAAGWRLTPQRRVIAEVLRGEHVHLTADEVFEQARASLPELGRATVYATLGEMVAQGLVQEVATGPGRRLFDPNVAVDHQHFVCRRCGAIRDVTATGITKVGLPAGDDARVEVVEVVLRGLCGGCR